MKRLNIALLVGFVGINLSTVACGGDSMPPSEPAAPAAVEEQPAATPALGDRPTGGEPSEAAAEAAESPDAEAPAERPRLVPAVRGMAEIGYLSPETKRAGGEVVTTFQIKNLATEAIAGLKVDEFWYDRDGNTVTGDSHRLPQPLLPGEEVTIELRVPGDSRLNTSKYSFTHQNGDIKATLLEEFIKEGEGESES